MSPEQFEWECARMKVKHQRERLRELCEIKPAAARVQALQAYWKELGAAYALLGGTQGNESQSNT